MKNVPLRLTLSVVEIRFGHILGRVFRADADIVDEHIDAPHGVVAFGNAASDVGQFADIHLDGKGSPALRVRLAHHVGDISRVAHAEHQIGAGAPAALRDGAADAARGARDEHHLAGKAEVGSMCVGHVVFPINI
jgi:hypothetical protein